MNKLFLKKVGLSFARAFLAVFIPGIFTVYDPLVKGDLGAVRSALIALAVASFAAVLRAAQALWTEWETDHFSWVFSPEENKDVTQ